MAAEKQTRRAHPSFLMPSEPPLRGAELERATFREHLRAWNRQAVGDGNALPHVVYVFVLLKLTVYVTLFWYQLRDPTQSLFSEQNFKRFLLYNIMGDLLGTNSTSGPLGMRMKFPFVTWYNLLRPGSITAPLLPGVRATRHWVQTIGFMALLYFIATALRAPFVTISHLAPVCGIWAILVPFDLVTFFAGRGEHYGYMLVCCLVPWKHALTGCQLIMLALWFFAGTAKIGPWMKYVMCFMMPNSLAMRLTDATGLLRFKDLFVDHPTDLSAHPMLKFLANFGCCSELALSTLNAVAPQLGVPLAIGFHCFILSMFPFASVMEWNVMCIYLTLCLFHYHSISVTAVLELASAFPLLAGFLALMLLCIPVYGQLYPKEIPFLAAYRPYAGNWRFTWHIVDGKAKDKLRKLKCLEGPFMSENASMLWGSAPDICDQLEDYFMGNMVFFPHFRPIVPIIEALKQARGWKKREDCAFFFNECFINAIMGWCLGTGDFVKGRAYFEALSTTCGFAPGECFVAVFEPQGLLDHTAEWHVVDVTAPDTKLIHGKVAYAELESFQPPDMPLKMLERCSVLDGAQKKAAEEALMKKVA